MEPLPEGVAPTGVHWVAMLRGESALASGPPHFRPDAECGSMQVQRPFKGRYAGAAKSIGYTLSRKNPRICARCIEHAPEGGAIVPVAILFADVRGYAALCGQLEPREVATPVQKFYETSSSACLRRKACSGRSPVTRSEASSCSG